MSAHSELPLPADDDAFVREAEFKALRRLAKLTESENERVALRACEVLLRYARERRREAEPPPAKADPKPPASNVKIPKWLIERPAPPSAFRAVPPAAVAGIAAPGAARKG